MADSRPTERAMKAAVEMEMHAAVGTTTVAKGETLDKCFPAYDDLLRSLRSILAFYEPGQTHLDTNAWTHAEASARRALAKAEGRS